MCPDLRSFCTDAALLWQTSSLYSNTQAHTTLSLSTSLLVPPFFFFFSPFLSPNSLPLFLSLWLFWRYRQIQPLLRDLCLWSGLTWVTEVRGLPWQQASLATHQEARTNWKRLSFPWDILCLFSAADPAPIPHYGKRVGGRERKKYQGFILFFLSMFSVGEDHRLFSERDNLFLIQRDEGGAHVYFWWTQLVSQRRKK